MATDIRPQAGPQTTFLSCPADIVFYGGGAGGGKSWSILLEPIRHIKNEKFNATYFRRTFPQIKNPGGLWDASMSIFPLVGGVPRQSLLKWVFPSGAYAVFRHLKQESNVLDWQGTELVYVAMDELTHFTSFQFWYIMSRMRSTSGVTPYFRGTCNPVTADDPIGGWVREFIDWWIGEDGLPIPERSGRVRHFIRRDGELVWFDEPTDETKSFTFIKSSIFDNPALLEKDPNYLNNLKALPQVERDRLLGGNWNVKAVAGKVFKSDWFEVIPSIPGFGLTVRFWDFAGTTAQQRGSDPDWTIGCKMLLCGDTAVILDVVAIQGTPAQVERALTNTASQDGPSCAVRWFRDPGQAGIYQDAKLRSLLGGYDAMGILDNRDKYTRAKSLSAAAEFGKVKLLRGAWNIGFINELSQFPDGKHDDQVDAAAGAYNHLILGAANVSNQGSFRI